MIFKQFVFFMCFFVSGLVVASSNVIEAGPREFKPVVKYIAPGDTVKFVKMVSHNTISVDKLIPEGASPWTSKLGENITLKFGVPGIYSYVCLPHIGFGMVGVIVVGDVTQDDIDAYKAKAMDVLEGPYRRLIGKINKLKPTK